MIAKILLTSIAQPHPQNLRNLFPLLPSKHLIKPNSPLTLTPTRFIIMCIPVTTRHTYPTIHLLNKLLPYQGFIELFPDILFSRHSHIIAINNKTVNA